MSAPPVKISPTKNPESTSYDFDSFDSFDRLSTCDSRVKRNIEPATNALELIRSLEPKRYIKETEFGSRHECGLVAQEVLKDKTSASIASHYVVPPKGPNEYYQIQPNSFHFYTMQAVKDLDMKVAEMERIIKIQGYEITTLRRIVENLVG